MTFFIEYSRTKKSKYCCHPPFHPPIFCRHSLKLLSPTLPKLMNCIVLSLPPLSSDPDTPQKKIWNVHLRYIQFRKSVAWLVMLNIQDLWSDHLTASAQPWPIVFSSVLFPAGPPNQRNHLQCHGWSLAITCYAMASVREPCEGSRHFIENGCILSKCWLLRPYPHIPLLRPFLLLVGLAWACQ